MAGRRNVGWYAVKTLYRTAPHGRAKGKDSFFAEGVTLVEERVVVFKARNFDEAIRKAEREAADYARDRYRNAYGQRVVTRYLGYCNAYMMGAGIDDAGVEVYSSTEVVAARVSDKQIVDRSIGARETPVMTPRRRNIMNIVFAGPAPGVRLNRQERESMRWRVDVRRNAKSTR